MRRREVVQFLGAALALPFIPRGAEAAMKLGAELHLRLGDTYMALTARAVDYAHQLLNRREL